MKFYRPQSGFWLIPGVLALIALLAIVNTNHRVSANPTVPSQVQGVTGWIIGSSTVALLRKAGASDSLMNRSFDGPATYLVVRPRLADTLPNATPTQTFTSFADLQQAFAASSIAPTTKAILYDNEKWQFTPPNEQQDPVGYASQVAALVHQHGLKLIVTPATNLASVLRPGARNKYDAFLSLNIIGGMAKVADVVEVQAQGAEGTPRYADFVQAASAQARAANPNVKFYAGMSTNPQGRLVSPQQLDDDYQATRHSVDGYWLNVPGRSAYCPTCGEPHPEVALAFLQMLSR